MWMWVSGVTRKDRIKNEDIKASEEGTCICDEEIRREDSWGSYKNKFESQEEQKEAKEGLGTGRMGRGCGKMRDIKILDYGIREAEVLKLLKGSSTYGRMKGHKKKKNGSFNFIMVATHQCNDKISFVISVEL